MRDESPPQEEAGPKVGVFPMQAALDSLRSDQEGTCWWCGAIADSREHRHKASVLRKMWGADGLYLGRPGASPYRLNSSKSSAVKFGRTLCRSCNNVKSQSFDLAYDTYAAYVQANHPDLAHVGRIDWRDVFGAGWEAQARDLGCYFVKNLGCWFAQDGFQPPSVFADFLNGADLVDTRVMPVRQHAATLAHRAMRLDGEPSLDRGIGFLESVGWISSDGSRLTGYQTYAYIADICMHLLWVEGAGENQQFWTAPVVALDVMPADMTQRAIAANIAARALGRRLRRALTRAGR